MKRKEAYIRDEAKLKALGSRLRALRRKKGMTMQELADLSNIEYSQLSRIERGIINTSLSSIFAISEALGVASKELFDDLD